MFVYSFIGFWVVMAFVTMHGFIIHAHHYQIKHGYTIEDLKSLSENPVTMKQKEINSYKIALTDKTTLLVSMLLVWPLSYIVIYFDDKTNVK